MDYVLRGVVVPAGEHLVEFAFRAPSVRLGAKYSAIGLLLLLIGALLNRKQ